MAQAEPVKTPGVWGFIPTSTQGSYIRAILAEANKNQNKYEFIFENRPGAGGAIAARYVLDYQGIALFANSAAHFIRPNLYPELSYKLSEFKPVMIMGMSPASLITKGKTLDQLLGQSKINFATSGTGSSTHLMAEALAREIKKKDPNKDIAMVHFASSNEAFLSVMGGHTDATFEFLGDAKAKALPDTTLIGLTGSKKIDGIAPLKDRGFNDMADLQGIFAFYVRKDTPQAVVDELQKILLEAERADAVQRLYRTDYASKDPSMTRPGDLTKWYDDTSKRFEYYTKGIQVK